MMSYSKCTDATSENGVVSKGDSIHYHESKFVGEDRLHIVDGLLAVFNRCVTTTTPQWVSLEGPTGCGKSRVVAEFYAKLAKSQPTPTYWPDSLLTTNDPALLRNIHTRRKQVYPKWQGSPNAYPEYMWWGVACGQIVGTPAESLASSLNQFVQHAEPLDKAYAASVKNPDKVMALIRNSARAIKDEGIAEVSTEMVDRFVRFITDRAIEQVPFVGMVTRVSKWAWNKALVTRARDKVVHEGKIINNAPSMEPVDEAFSILTRLSYRSLVPVIVYIEDLHDADEALIALLEKILRQSDIAITVITTTWVGELEHQDKLAPLYRLNKKELLLGDRYHRITELGVESSTVLKYGSFAVLSVSDRLAIVKNHFPELKNKYAEKIAARYEQPLMLEMIVTSEWLKEDYGEDLEEIDAIAIETLPFTVDEYYTVAWDRLPESAKQTLIHATTALVQFDEDGSEYTSREWSLFLLKNAVSALNSKSELIDSFDDEPRVLGWVRKVDERLSMFREWQHVQFASGNLTDVRRIKVLNALSKIAADELNQDSGGYGDDGYLEWLILSLAATKRIGKRPLDRPFINDRMTIARAAGRRMNALIAFPSELHETIRMGKIFVDHSDDADAKNVLQTRINIATWTAMCGDLSSAIAQLKKLKPDIVRVHGEDSELMFSLREKIAILTAQAGDYSTADTMLGLLLEDAERSLGAECESVLHIRHHEIYWSRFRRHVNDLIERQACLVNDFERLFGAEHKSTLSAKCNLAGWTGESGNREAAYKLYRAIHEDQSRVLGEEHPNTLSTLSQIAYYVGHLQGPAECIRLYKDLLNIFDRVFGSFHPRTLRIESHIAGWKKYNGSVEQALQQYNDVLDKQLDVLGPVHPDTFETRENIANCSADAQVAVTKFKAISSMSFISTTPSSLVSPLYTQSLIQRHSSKLVSRT